MEMASYGLGELVFGYGFASVLHMYMYGKSSS